MSHRTTLLTSTVAAIFAAALMSPAVAQDTATPPGVQLASLNSVVSDLPTNAKGEPVAGEICKSSGHDCFMTDRPKRAGLYERMYGVKHMDEANEYIVIDADTILPIGVWVSKGRIVAQRLASG